MSDSNGERLREALEAAGALDIAIHFGGRRDEYPAAQTRCLERAAAEYDRATAERVAEIDERLMRTEQMLLSKTADAFLAEQERDTLRDRLPRCQVVEDCTNVAACFVFSAEGDDEYAFSCDEHCGHGNEDMHCESLANFAATFISERNNAAEELEDVRKERDELAERIAKLETKVECQRQQLSKSMKLTDDSLDVAAKMIAERDAMRERLTMRNDISLSEQHSEQNREAIQASTVAELYDLRERLTSIEGPPQPGTTQVRLMVLHKRDDAPWAAYPFETHTEARIAYDHFAAAWTGTFLVRIMAGPPDEVQGETMPMPSIFEELIAERNDLRARLTKLTATADKSFELNCEMVVYPDAYFRQKWAFEETLAEIAAELGKDAPKKVED